MSLFMFWAVAILASAILYLFRVYSMFSDRGVKNKTPWPLIGNMWQTVLRVKTHVYAITDMYHEFASERFFGLYEFLNPILIVKDLDLIKQITVKDFDHFADHRALIDTDGDPLFGNNLFFMAGHNWKTMRSNLSPAFTSSKIKLMVPFMEDVGNQMLANLKKTIKESGVGFIERDVKALASRYTNDVIASCAFGLKTDSFNDENNQFYKMGKEASTFEFSKIIKSLIYRSLPDSIGKGKVSVFSESASTFFMKLVTDMIKEREEKNIVRPDMIHLLIEAKKGKLTHDGVKDEDGGFAAVEESNIGLSKNTKKEWTDVELTAQAVVFFFAGFDTVSTALSFLLLELAVNPEVQDKLVQEIRETDQKNGGKFDYKKIQEMPYLDMVVSELVRLWPPGQNLDRMCVKDYNMGKPNPKSKKDYIMRKGEGMAIPVYAIHRDPAHYPNPDKFDPERFSEENRRNIKPSSYMPFGLGPRNCIGSRFALCEVKVMIYQFLREMEVTPTPKTCIPVEFDPKSFTPKAKGGFWLKISVRK